MSNPFAVSSDEYARYRPVYPTELFHFLISLVHQKQHLWDCGTGNGQLAVGFAGYFDHVYATDISAEQIQNAPPHKRMSYSVQPAERTNFGNNFFDMITVAQAVHWFDFEKFYLEVNRTLRNEGIISLIGYGLFRVSPSVNRVVDDFYKFTDPYWDPQRKFIDDAYRTIPFPFNEIQTPSFFMTAEWNFDHLVGFLRTWSAVKHFIKAEGKDPVKEIMPALQKAWGADSVKQVSFPLFMKVGRKAG